MSGFRPVGEAAAAAVEDALVEVDRRLADYESAWDSLVDSWLVIKIADPQVRCQSALPNSSLSSVSKGLFCEAGEMISARTLLDHKQC